MFLTKLATVDPINYTVDLMVCALVCFVGVYYVLVQFTQIMRTHLTGATELTLYMIWIN